MIVQLHIPASKYTNCTGGTKKKKQLEKQEECFLKSQLKKLHNILPLSDKKKGNFSGTKVLPWYVPLSLEREKGTYVKHTCHLHRSVGMCVYVSIYVYMLIYIWICTHITSIDHRIMFHWKPAHRENRATWNQSLTY